MTLGRRSISTVGLTGMARKTVAECVERINLLYEQGADALRIGQYVRRWLRWSSGGLGQYIRIEISLPPCAPRWRPILEDALIAWKECA